jgi:hypothetical protein
MKPFLQKAANFTPSMKKIIFIFLVAFQFLLLTTTTVSAQCSLCTKTAQQLGEKPALGLNNGILYLMVMPFALVGFIGFRWYKNNKDIEEDERI